MSEQTFILAFTQIEMQTLSDALVELPFRRAQPVITSINKQLAEADQKLKDSAPEIQLAEVKSDGTDSL